MAPVLHHVFEGLVLVNVVEAILGVHLVVRTQAQRLVVQVVLVQNDFAVVALGCKSGFPHDRDQMFGISHRQVNTDEATSVNLDILRADRVVVVETTDVHLGPLGILPIEIVIRMVCTDLIVHFLGTQLAEQVLEADLLGFIFADADRSFFVFVVYDPAAELVVVKVALPIDEVVLHHVLVLLATVEHHYVLDAHPRKGDAEAVHAARPLLALLPELVP